MWTALSCKEFNLLNVETSLFLLAYFKPFLQLPFLIYERYVIWEEDRLLQGTLHGVIPEGHSAYVGRKQLPTYLVMLLL